MCLFLKPEKPVEIAPGVTGIVTVDLNADGLTDLVMADPTAGRIEVVLGAAKGRLGAAHDYPVPAGVSSLVVLDRHGAVDLAALNAQTGALTILANDGHAHFTVASTTVEPAGTTLLAAADLAGSGNQDVILGNATAETVTTIAANGATRIYHLRGAPTALTTADLNADGTTDVVAAVGTHVDVLLNDGQGGLKPEHAYAAGSTPIDAVFVADVNGGAPPDLLAVAIQGGFVVDATMLVNNGHGGFTAAATHQAAPDLGSPQFAVADLGGAGMTDLIVATGRGLYVDAVSAAGGLTVAASLTLQGIAEGVSVADLVPGGRPDILVTLDTGQVEVVATSLHAAGSALTAAPILQVVASSSHPA